MLRWIGFGLLSAVLLAGYPLVYRIYLSTAGNEAVKQLNEYEALSVYGGCLAVSSSPVSSKKDIESCTPFFTIYLPQKTNSVQVNAPWPLALPKEQIREVYRGVNKARVVYSLAPLPPLEQLTHGHLQTTP